MAHSSVLEMTLYRRNSASWAMGFTNMSPMAAIPHRAFEPLEGRLAPLPGC